MVHDAEVYFVAKAGRGSSEGEGQDARLKLAVGFGIAFTLGTGLSSSGGLRLNQDISSSPANIEFG